MPIIHPSVFAPSDQDLSSSSISSRLYTNLYYTSATDLDLDLGVQFCVGDALTRARARALVKYVSLILLRRRSCVHWII